jgi:serine protease AprX
MSLTKISAYFMRDEQDKFIAANLQNAIRTDNFYIGEVSDEGKAKLEDVGIYYHEIAKVEDNFPYIFEVQSRSAEAVEEGGFKFLNVEDIAAEENNASFPKYYKFDIEGPLLDTYTNWMKELGLTVGEFFPPHSYSIRIEDAAQYEKCAASGFIKNLRYYNSFDSGIVELATRSISKPPEEKIGKTEKAIQVFDILLHSPDDLQAFIGFLQEEHVSIAGAEKDKVRIYLVEGLDLLAKITSHKLLKYIHEYIPPTIYNDVAAQLIGINVAEGANTPNIYFGEGQIVGIADTGIDNNHPDLVNQIYKAVSWGRNGITTDPHGHGSHVAGSVAGDGSGSNGTVKGMAPKAKIFFQSLLNDMGRITLPLRLQDLFEEAHAQGARIHNNSWGSSTASKYTVNSMEVDDFVFKNKDMLLVFSAGNDGTCINPKNVTKGFVDFLSIGSPASAKNVLTVGASRSSRQSDSGGFTSLTYRDAWPNLFPFDPIYTKEKVSGDAKSMAAFSSRGPCDDLRIKPDVVAPGTDIVSVKSAQAPLSNFWGIYPPNNKYAYMGGTSMSAPIVSGFAALIREYFIKKHQHEPSAALLKAAIINGCIKIDGQDAVLKFPDLPNYNQGFGRVDLSKTIPQPETNFYFNFIDNYQKPAEHLIKTGQGIQRNLKLTAPGWIKICLVYTDIPARALQNNLNLFADMASHPDSPWRGNQNAPSLLHQLDTVNNVEIISIENAFAGDYIIKVVATNLIKGPQDFAVVITTSDINTIIK